MMEQQLLKKFDSNFDSLHSKELKLVMIGDDLGGELDFICSLLGSLNYKYEQAGIKFEAKSIICSGNYITSTAELKERMHRKISRKLNEENDQLPAESPNVLGKEELLKKQDYMIKNANLVLNNLHDISDKGWQGLTVEQHGLDKLFPDVQFPAVDNKKARTVRSI
ncbi:MAG: hypothetical protein AAF195_04735 [Pseudomonadota bacterium]